MIRWKALWNSTCKDMKTRIFVLMFLFIIVCHQICAEVFYVDNHGSDLNNGRMETPFRTIQRGVSYVFPGDTVFVRAGTYHEVVNVRNSGTRELPLTLLAHSLTDPWLLRYQG